MVLFCFNAKGNFVHLEWTHVHAKPLERTWKLTHSKEEDSVHEQVKEVKCHKKPAKSLRTVYHTICSVSRRLHIKAGSFIDKGCDLMTLSHQACPLHCSLLLVLKLDANVTSLLSAFFPPCCKNVRYLCKSLKCTSQKLTFAFLNARARIWLNLDLDSNSVLI